MRSSRPIATILALILTSTAVLAQTGFTNFETPHVSPLALSADGTRLFVTNTADNRLEVFGVASGVLTPLFDVPVGLDPVSVRERSATEVWVVNTTSDTVSIVDLTTGNVVRSLATAQEPQDVVFAMGRAFVSCGHANVVQVFDLSDLDALPIDVPIEGEEPRAMVTDGATVFVAIFESGNATTVIGEDVVSDPAGPYSGTNPPPNSGGTFDPPLNLANPAAPVSAVIVRKDPLTNDWLDDNTGVWTSGVPWDLHDHDMAVIDANTLAVTYVSGVMNANMQLSKRPDGRVVLIGIDAINEVRYEPIINGRFVQSIGAIVDPNGAFTTLDLNPHLAAAYSAALSQVPQAQRDISIADPRGIAWTSDSGRGFITGMGSNNVIEIDVAGNRVDELDVGQGPTGIVLSADGTLAYVLNKFDATITTVDLVGWQVVDDVPFHDPTPDVIRDGRPFLYDATRTSGMGVTACASCHIDARMDQLVWDLGDPSGDMMPFNQTCQAPFGDLCEDFHPLKGPMSTQTLQGIVTTEPFHWRGDREGLSAFNGAFESLLGDDTQLTVTEMNAFEAFIGTIKFPPNPNRTLDNRLAGLVAGGSPTTGKTLFNTGNLDGGAVNCSVCHVISGGGTSGQITPASVMDSAQSMKIAQMRNMWEKTGFDKFSQSSNRGFGFTHNGTIASLVEFLEFPVFSFPAGAVGDQMRIDVASFSLSFPNGTHAGVGTQVTLDGTNDGVPEVVALLQLMRDEADLSRVGLVAKGLVAGEARGWTYVGADTFQSDRDAETILDASLRALAGAGNEITYTMVPDGDERRIGIDRDADGVLDRDEIDACGDPADPNVLPIDIDGSGLVDLGDLAILLANFGTGTTHAEGDLNGDGIVDLGDLAMLLGRFGNTCG